MNNKMMKHFLYFNVIFLFLTGYISRAQEYDNYYNGLAKYQSGDFKSAISFFNEAMNDDLKHDKILHYRAECYFNIGDIESSKADFVKLKTHNISEGSYGLAKCFTEEGEIGLSIDELKIHLSQNNKIPRGFIRMDKSFSKIKTTNSWEELWNDEWYSKYDQLYEDANYYYLKADFDRAFELIETLIEKKPRNHKAYALRAMVYEKTGDLKKAKEDYSKAISIRKKHAKYYEGRARVLSEMGKYKLAYKDISTSVELDRYNPDYLFIQAQELYNLEQNKEALTKLRFYLGFFENNHGAIYLLGKCYYSNGDYSDAIIQFTKAIDLNPGNPKFYLGRGNSFLMVEDYENSENDLSMALDLDPNLAQVYMSRGIVRINRNDDEAACRDFKKAYKYGYLKAVEMIQEYCGE